MPIATSGHYAVHSAARQNGFFRFPRSELSKMTDTRRVIEYCSDRVNMSSENSGSPFPASQAVAINCPKPTYVDCGWRRIRGFIVFRSGTPPDPECTAARTHIGSKLVLGRAQTNWPTPLPRRHPPVRPRSHSPRESGSKSKLLPHHTSKRQGFSPCLLPYSPVSKSSSGNAALLLSPIGRATGKGILILRGDSFSFPVAPVALTW